MTRPQDWLPELDALIAAPGNHTLLLENDSVRVLDTHVLPGHIVPLHTHQWPGALYIVTWSDFVRRDAQHNVLLDTRNSLAVPEKSARWSGPLPPHTLENVGQTELRVITVELKKPE